jgi:hypothetical protein
MKLNDQAILFYLDGFPSQPSSPSTDSLLLCLKRYYLPRGTVLTDKLGSVVISPTTGEPMLCHGRWNSPTSIDLFRNAVQKLISQYERTTVLKRTRHLALGALPFPLINATLGVE